LGRTKSFQHAGISPPARARAAQSAAGIDRRPTGEGKRIQRWAKVGGSSRGAIRGVVRPIAGRDTHPLHRVDGAEEVRKDDRRNLARELKERRVAGRSRVNPDLCEPPR
jgi:hypothetical protein